jgi:PAS domain S-box-containing protein
MCHEEARLSKKDADQKELSLRMLVESVEDYAIFMLDQHGRVASWNPGAERIKGYCEKEIIGRHFSQFFEFEAAERLEPQWALNVASAEGRCSVQGWRIRKGGSRFWADVLITAIYDKDRQLVGYSNITRDVTGKKCEEDRFRLAVESAPNAIVMIDSAGKIVLVNAQTEKMFGFSREELLGRCIEVLVPERFRSRHPGYRAGFFAHPQARAMGGGRDLYGLKKDGSEIPVEIGLNPIRTDEGDFVLAAIVDISERKRAEEERKKAEERFRVAVESAPNPMVMVNDEGKIVMINQETEKLFGFTREELLGRPVDLLVPARFRGEHTGYRSRFLEAPQARVMGAGRDLFGLRKDGTEVAVELGLNPIKTREGEFVLAAIVDITERKKAELERQEFDRAKSIFFSNMSHEFRTPLTLLLGPLEDLIGESCSPGEPGFRERLQMAHRNALRLLKLVNALLDFSSIEAGRVQASYEPVDLGSFTAELATLFSAAVERAGLKLLVDCPRSRELPYVDREMWETIVFNLLSNALKFTFEGEISLRLQEHAKHVELQVQDTGIGISEEELPRLFERFHRVRNVRARTQEGTGIGLALVWELVKLHGGTVSAASEPQRGTTITVKIPLGVGHLPPERISGPQPGGAAGVGAGPYIEELRSWIPQLRQEQLPAQTEPVAGPARADSAQPAELERARVLLADDNADMREYIARLLREHWDVQVVSDGLAALAAARSRTPDLVLADVLMPGLDGLGLLRELRSDAGTSTIPVILLSARAGEEATVQGLQAGADDYLVKPFTGRELLARVQSNLELAHLRRRVERDIRQMNEQLETRVSERTAELRELVAEMETFAYTVAHDLRAPLRSMHRFCHLLMEEYSGRLDEAGKDYARRIAHAASRMDVLIQDLLAYSRVARSEIQFNEVDLDGLVAGILFDMKGEIGERAADVSVHEPLPKALGDPLLISEAVRNLVANAIKFSRPGISPVVSIFGEERGGKARLWVEDNGIGIDPKFSNRLFRVFERLEPAGPYPGTGIGLAIVRRAVERMGGQSGFEAAAAGGTRFWIELPSHTTRQHHQAP